MTSPDAFEIVINATHPAHGCAKEASGLAYGCGSLDCPDCITAQFLQTLIRCGCNIQSATIVHDPSGAKIVDSYDYGILTKRDPSASRMKRTRKGG